MYSPLNFYPLFFTTYFLIFLSKISTRKKCFNEITVKKICIQMRLQQVFDSILGQQQRKMLELKRKKEGRLSNNGSFCLLSCSFEALHQECGVGTPMVRARATSIILEGQKKGRNKVPLLSKKGSFINYIFSKSVIYDTLPPNCYLYYYTGIIYWSVQQQNYYLKQSATQRYFASVYIDKAQKKSYLVCGILHRS